MDYYAKITERTQTLIQLFGSVTYSSANQSLFHFKFKEYIADSGDKTILQRLDKSSSD
jgi:hypothetical protein